MPYAQHARSRASGPVVEPPERTPIEIDAGGRSLGAVVALALASVRRSGAAVIRHDPDDPTPPEHSTAMLVTAIEATGQRALTTPRGRIVDMRTARAAAGDDELRTELPFLARPPSLLFLQCLRPPDGGEEFALADARAAFLALEHEDARVAGVLASVRVRFDDEHGARYIVAPMIDRDEFLIRGGPFVLAPDRFTLAAATELCAAHERLSRSLHDPRHLARVRLGRGDWLLLDNHRTLHARAEHVGESWSRKVHLDPCIS